MTKTFFVANIKFDASEIDLAQAFQEVGYRVKSARICTDRTTGNSRGFGFVDLELEEGATIETVIEDMADRDLMGRQLKIMEANERKERQAPPRRRRDRSERFDDRDLL